MCFRTNHSVFFVFVFFLFLFPFKPLPFTCAARDPDEMSIPLGTGVLKVCCLGLQLAL